LVIQYRVEHQLTQTALARQFGVKQPAVARLEAGDHEPSVATLARLANRLGITIHLDLSPGLGGARLRLTSQHSLLDRLHLEDTAQLARARERVDG
jgi:transcriptional regulator with XRE-family HTH domain